MPPGTFWYLLYQGGMIPISPRLALVDCLAAAGYESHVQSLCLSSPTTLEGAVANVCKTGPLVATAHTAAQQYMPVAQVPVATPGPITSHGPVPMQVDAMSIPSAAGAGMDNNQGGAASCRGTD
jgi:hypothetical protein